MTKRGLEPLTLGLWFQYSTIELFRPIIVKMRGKRESNPQLLVW
jgi:hypothetical protein